MNEDVASRLAEPFGPDHLEWKPQTVSGNRCMVIAYIDARAVMDRLDAVCGVCGWRDEYFPLGDGNVKCRLSLRLGGEWVSKEDVGGESDQRDAGDKTKAAFSDALKRAAVKFGVGRYLYSLPHQWCDYDPAKKRIVGTPSLPDWARPRKSAAPAAAPPADQAKQKVFAAFVADLKAAKTLAALKASGEAIRAATWLSPRDRDDLKVVYADRLDELKEREAVQGEPAQADLIPPANNAYQR